VLSASFSYTTVTSGFPCFLFTAFFAAFDDEVPYRVRLKAHDM